MAQQVKKNTNSSVKNEKVEQLIYVVLLLFIYFT